MRVSNWLIFFALLVVIQVVFANPIPLQTNTVSAPFDITREQVFLVNIAANQDFRIFISPVNSAMVHLKKSVDGPTLFSVKGSAGTPIPYSSELNTWYLNVVCSDCQGTATIRVNTLGLCYLFLFY